MIKAVFIDVDDTLLDWEKNAYHSSLLTAKEMNITLPDNIMEVFETINTELWHQFEQGLIVKEDIFERRWKSIFEVVNIVADPHQFEMGFVKNLHFSYICCPYAKEIMEYLSGKYPTYIATNASYSQQLDRLVGCGLDKYALDIFVSERAGFAKPKKEFFDYCFKDLQFKPEEVAMIGDSLNADISGAKDYGLTTIWINRHNKEKTEKVDYEISDLKQIENIL